MSQDLALVPQLLSRRGNKLIENFAAIGVGVTGLSISAQLALPLPWTPVPITGQTFGVALIALLWGRRRGLAIILSYLTLAALGMPVLASGRSGLSLGPTSGYLVGMVLATYWMGTWSDRGWTRTWLQTYVGAFFGSVITFACGVAVLSFFIPRKDLLSAGVLPFLPGDLIKTLLASWIVSRFQANRTGLRNFLFILLLPLSSFAAVDVAFLEVRNRTGKLIQLEPGGRFAHIAISYQGQWLHAHPVFGVQILSHRDLQRLGKIAELISLDIEPLSEAQIREFAGKPYDFEFSWSDEKIYCSELVAKLLRIPPQPMSFAAPFWPPQFRRLNGQLGLSPDDIYAVLRSQKGKLLIPNLWKG